MGRATLAALLWTALLAAPAAAGETGRVEGRVVLVAEGASLANAGPVVVYLEIERGAPDAPKDGARPEVRQRQARFTPGFLAVVRGQTVAFPNDDDVQHNVYSYSGENEFDLGVYPAGATRSVTFDHAGVVEIHCSVHESMNGTIFVAPSPWYARVDAAGRFAVDGLPPGRYRLRTWSERLPRAELFLRVSSGSTLRVDVPIGEATP